MIQLRKKPSELVEDYPEEGIFRVHRDAFTDLEVFEQELKDIFGSAWVFLGIEDQISQPHDYFTWSIGRTPVIVSRSQEGTLHGYVNACRHKGAIVAPLDKGNARRHTCPYHGWVYDSTGKNVGIKGEKVEGAYNDAFNKCNHDLLPLPGLASYRGLIFGTLNPDAPPLETYLGDMCGMLDLVLDQGANGMEFVPGKSNYTFNGNWKLQMDNGLDYYHLTSAHTSYMRVLSRRSEGAGNQEAQSASWSQRMRQRSGMLGFNNGHVMLWVDQAEPHKRPIYHFRDELIERVGQTRYEWMLRPRQYLVFPNLQFADSSTTVLRTFRPISPNCTEMRMYCLAPKGEKPEARSMRIRQFEDFYASSGLATPDDSVLYERCQQGLEARDFDWMQGYARAIAVQEAQPSAEAQELGIQPAVSIAGDFDLQNEVSFFQPWRAWTQMMQTSEAKTAPTSAE